MTKEDIDAEVAQAWKVWSDVTDLTFEQKKSGKVHVDGLRARWLVELHDRVGRLLVRKCLYLLVALGGRRLASRRVVDHLCIAFALNSFILL